MFKVSNQPKVMGVLNLTPDSFSDGGVFINKEDAIRHALNMVDEGADIIDIGAESTRPGAIPVGAEQELDRLMPVVSRLKELSDIPISVDTSKPVVMQAACEAGVEMINDINALQAPGALEVVTDSPVKLCLMHKQGEPTTMQSFPEYEDVVDEVKAFLVKRVEACLDAGIDSNRLCVDVGIGFGKTVEQNLTLIKNLKQFQSLTLPILIGIYREITKDFI